MRRCVLFGLLIGLSVLMGCGPGVVKTKAERVNAFREGLDLDMRQMADDWDTLWLVNRQYRLTRWQIR
ncbi:MAG: hypothetical protein ACE5I3_04520 [Phycisphaerae bacterium]